MSQRRRHHGSLLRMTAAVLAIAVIALATVVGLGVRGAPAASNAGAAIEIHSAHGASFVPALRGQRPLFILALGSDARPGQPVARERSDSIHIIGIDTVHHRATILGFPRDSFVNIPGFGRSKINNTLLYGGPPLAVRTLERLTGIPIDLWMLTSFNGLSNMVQGIGGIQIDVPRPMHDIYSHANFSAGPHHLKGWQALAFARDRHSLPNGDFDRSADQGLLFRAALTQLRKAFARDPSVVFHWMSVGWHNISSDLTAPQLLDLALTATHIPTSNVNNLVVPGSGGNYGLASVVFISPAAQAIYAAMRKDGTFP
jgi:LCP family protein required for cell wall assembly